MGNGNNSTNKSTENNKNVNTDNDSKKIEVDAKKVPNKKKRYIIAAALGILTGFCIYELACLNNGSLGNPNALAVKDRTVEYGTKLDTLFDAGLWLEDGQDASGATVAIDQKDKMRKEYLEVGTYTVRLTDGNKKGKGTLTVKDTKSPKWVKTTDKIELATGEKLKVTDYFKAKDLSKVTYSTDKDVDASKKGKTSILVTAEDRYGNKVSKRCEVEVTSKEKVKETEKVENKVQEESKKETIRSNEISKSPSSAKASNKKSESKSSTKNTNSSQNSSANASSSNNVSSNSSASGSSGSNSSNSTTNNNQSQNTQASAQQPEQTPAPTPQPEPQPDPTPACDPIPAGAYADYGSANAAAKQALLQAVIDNGWTNGRYGVDTHQTNCGTLYYTYWVAEFK